VLVKEITIRKAVIPAAGYGFRFLPATKAQPKEMLPVVDKPVIQFVVEEALTAGIDDIIIITGKEKRAIIDHFDRSFELERVLEARGKLKELEMVRKLSEVDIHYIRQSEPLGLGHAVNCARKHVGGEPFAIMLGDDFYSSKVPQITQLINAFSRLGGSILGVKEVQDSQVSRYGMIKPEVVDERTFLVKDIIEKPPLESAPSRIAWMGRAIMAPSVFDYLKDLKPGYGGEVQLTDAMKLMCRNERMYAYLYDGIRYDVGDKMSYLKAIIDYGLTREDIRGELLGYIRKIIDGP
jgi:UTP--glucose-1-phosphate uridylyltransferase